MLDPGLIEESDGYSLALSFQVLAVEAIIEASSVVTLRVTLAIVEVAPALQGS